MAYLQHGTFVTPHVNHQFQCLGTLGASCTDAVVTYSNLTYGVVFVMSSHNNGQGFKQWGYGKAASYEGIQAGDEGGSGPYATDMCSNGGTIGVQTHSAAPANHSLNWHTLRGAITADAAYAFAT